MSVRPLGWGTLQGRDPRAQHMARLQEGMQYGKVIKRGVLESEHMGD